MSAVAVEPADSPTLGATRCTICRTFGLADEVYPSTLDLDALTSRHFSARRDPDGVHHRIVRCRICGLVRSDPVLDHDALEALYRASTFDYGAELDGLGVTYGQALDRVGEAVGRRGALLDIGCGSGFALSLALQRGWERVCGVEPSDDAIANASADVRTLIVQEMMRPGLFAPQSFDAITLFQVLDHMPDPMALLKACHTILRPGGVILAFNHNVEARSARVLGERSPIVDVEHTYLYSPQTMRSLFAASGFSSLSVGPVRNTYSTSYLVHLLPLPTALKQAVMPPVARTALGRMRVTVGLGNLCLIGRRER